MESLREPLVQEKRGKVAGHSKIGLYNSGSAADIQGSTARIRAGGEHFSAEYGRHGVYGVDVDFRLPTWSGNGSDTVVLRKFIEDLKHYRRRV